jgi:hypothetical protein
MTVRTLLPAKPEIVAVGGPGREFLNPFNNTNYPPSRPPADSREAGRWRMEVIADRGTREFLHALAIGGSVTGEPIEGVAGAHFPFPDGAEVLAFAGALPVSYRLTSPQRARHLLAGLPPGSELTLVIGGRSRKVRVNPNGLLQFDDAARGGRSIRLNR